MLVLERILIFALLGTVLIFMIGLPVFKLIKLLKPKKHDPVGDARVRLEVAKKEVEAAKLNKETEQVYSELYQDILEEDDVTPQKKVN